MLCLKRIIWLFVFGLVQVAVVQSRSYSVVIFTGYYEANSPVDIRFVGDRGTTSSHRLVAPGNAFKKYSKNMFRGLTDRDVGKLTAVEVYLHSGSSSRWSLEKVLVISSGIYTFPNGFNYIRPGQWTPVKASCPSGTEMGPRGCVDIDECKRNPCRGPLAKCINTIRSYRCECPRGYRLRYEKFCEDINECLISHECEDYCTNTQGSYKCGCQAGFRLVGGTKCVDVNECLEGTHNCDRESTYCSNVRGGFYCYCNPGYKRVNSTHCQIRYCGDLSYYVNKKTTIAPSRCLTSQAGRYKDTCTMVCNYGYEMKDPSRANVTCGKDGLWKGGFSYCRGVKCPPVKAVANAVTYPDTCLTVGGRHDSGSNCNQYCKSGYENIGGRTLVCQANGTWSGLPAICKKTYPNPWISCPSSVNVDLPPGKNTTSLGSKWNLPTSNVKNLTVSPSWANQFYKFPYGETKITWTATNGDGKTASCVLYVNVADKEPPKITFCPGPHVFQAAYTSNFFVKFKRPTFTDNVGVASVTPEYKGGIQMKYIGHLNQYFTARDKAGNTVTCKFEIIAGGAKCSLTPDDDGYPGSWTTSIYGLRSIMANRVCPHNTISYGTYGVYLCDDSEGTWKPPKIGDCVAFIKANKTIKCPEGFGRSPSKHQAGMCMQCPLGTYYKDVGRNTTCIQCPAGSYQDQRGSTSCKTCPQGTSSLQEAFVCRELCPRGTFSKDGMRPFCSLCPQGQYQPNKGQTSCLTCPNNKFTNTKLGSYSCGDVKPPASSEDLPTIERVVNPTVLNTTSTAANVFECYIVKDNNYDQVAVRWEVIDGGIPADFLGSMKHQELTNGAGKPTGARLTLTRARMYNALVKYACNAYNPNGKTQRVVTVRDT